MSFKNTSKIFKLLFLVAVLTGMFAATALAAADDSYDQGQWPARTPVVTTIQEGKHFAGVNVTRVPSANIEINAHFSAAYTLQATEWNGDLHTYPLFTINGVTDASKLTLTYGDENNLNQADWFKLGNISGYPDNVYGDTSGTHVFFDTPATDNAIWTLYYDGVAIATYRLDLIVAPVVTAVAEGKNFAAVDVTNDGGTGFSAVYTVKASE